MNHIRNVIEGTATPAWLSSVPRNFGDAKAGTLKADEWRTLFTVYIPLALVSFWGEGSTHATQEQTHRVRKILDHTMLLVSATTIAMYRTMTPERARAYKDYMLQYIQDLKSVHPSADYRCNHHMSVHIYDFLLLFGPVHSWWCFPFECLIGMLQRLPTNHRPGGLCQMDLIVALTRGFSRTPRRNLAERFYQRCHVTSLARKTGLSTGYSRMQSPF